MTTIICSIFNTTTYSAQPTSGPQEVDAIGPSKTSRLYLLLKERIASGRLDVGDRLPSETDLAAAHKLSRVTVRRALDGLESDGLIRRQPGAGTFIVGGRTSKAIVGDLTNTMAHLVAMGRATRVRLIAFGYESPSAEIRTALGLSADERVQRAVRVRYLDGKPFSYLVTHVPERIGATYSEFELGSRPLLELLERSGIVAERARQKITATLAGPDVAPDLDVEVGAPLLSLVRIVYGAGGRGVEHLSALYRPDLYQFEMELSRTGSEEERYWNPVALARPVRKKSRTERTTRRRK